MNTNSDRGIFALSVSELGPTLGALQKHGVTVAHLDMLRANNGDNYYAKRFAQALTLKAFETSTDTRIARLVLGKSFVDVADWVTLYGARFSRKEVHQALKFPWHEDILMGPCPFNPGQLVKDTHPAFLGLEKLNGSPLNVMKWNELHPKKDDLQPRMYCDPNHWYATEKHTTEVLLQPRWYLMLTEIVPDSWNKLPEEQEQMLPKEYEIPTTVAETTKDLLVFRKTDIRPNPTRWARCAEKTSDGYLSCVGLFDGYGLHVHSWYGYRNDHVGLGASRKF